MGHLLIQGDARRLPIRSGSVHCVVTSPPYWGGLRDYGSPGQLGLERDPADYVEALVGVFRLARRALSPDGSLWINVGDVYAASGKGGGGRLAQRRSCWDTVRDRKGFNMPPAGYKMKDLTLTPFALADALRRDGWYLRATIVWRKPNATEPMRIDRPSASHEYVFLLTPNEHSHVRNPGERWWASTVWDIAPDGSGVHPATMPLELAMRCIRAGCPEGGLVVDPFAGSGTTLVACLKAGRQGIGIELSPEYCEVARRRLRDAATPLFDALEAIP